MKKSGIATVDLGASGGRISVLARDGDALELKTVHRFVHPVHVLSQRNASGLAVRRYWNPGVIHENILTGLRAVPDDIHLESVGINGWGSDGVWLDRDGSLLGLPSQGRETRWIEANAEIEAVVPDRERFRLTGVRNESFCHVNLLYWHARRHPRLVELADAFLPLPSLFNYWLCGQRAAERSWIGTGQLMGIDGGYCGEVFGRLGLPRDKMPPIVGPGAALGKLHPLVAEAVGRPECAVTAPAQHDTACAFAAARALAGADANTLVISAGTWWLSGMELSAAVVDDAAYDAALTNVPGDSGWILHHIGFGSWPAQELRREWSLEDGNDMSWEEFDALALSDAGEVPTLDTNDVRLLSPENMGRALGECAGLRAPGRARLARLAYEGLVAATGKIVSNLSAVSGRKIERILIVGGGAKNDALNQRLADATGIEIRTALPNATTLGSALIQARALGWYGSLSEAAGLLPMEPMRAFRSGGNGPLPL
ncbi:MAG: hypothetical protein LBT97_01500 [Planctomycetota bacterium]|jgi:rhamnulokinase|nr:hypothetical protein [Planctomycetota bacterium]